MYGGQFRLTALFVDVLLRFVDISLFRLGRLEDGIIDDVESERDEDVV
jgi:hypothetical protein